MRMPVSLSVGQAEYCARCCSVLSLALKPNNNTLKNLVKKPVAITTPFVARKKSSGKKDRGYDAEVGVVDSTRGGGTIFGFILTKLGP